MTKISRVEMEFVESNNPNVNMRKTHPLCQPGEIYLGKIRHDLALLSQLRSIRQIDDSNRPLDLSGEPKGGAHIYHYHTFALEAEIRQLLGDSFDEIHGDIVVTSE